MNRTAQTKIRQMRANAEALQTELPETAAITDALETIETGIAELETAVAEARRELCDDS